MYEAKLISYGCGDSGDEGRKKHERLAGCCVSLLKIAPMSFRTG